MRILPRFAGGALLLALLPASAVGQARVLTISLAGVSNAKVADVEGGARKVMGTVAPDRPFALDFSAINAVKGKKYQVAMHQTAEGENTILLLGAGEHDTVCDASRQPAGEARQQGTDRCVLLATVEAGETATLGVTETNGMLDAVTSTFWRPQFTASVTYGRTDFTKLRDVACSTQMIPGLGTCTVDKNGTTLGASLELHAFPRLRVGVGFRHSSYSAMQMFGTEPVTHDVSVNAIGPYVRYDLLDGPVIPYFQGGTSMFFNSSKVTSLSDLLDNRSESGLRVGGVFGLDYNFGNGFGVRAAAGYDTGGSNDADTGVSTILGFTYTF